jgi:hypothetical protein
MGLFNTTPFQIIKEVRVMSIAICIEVMGILPGIVTFYRRIHLLQTPCIVSFLFHPLITPINVDILMQLHTYWIDMHLGSMKYFKDSKGVAEVEGDTEVDEMVEEGHFTATIVMSKKTWKEIVHFQEYLGVHIAGITLIPLKTS